MATESYDEILKRAQNELSREEQTRLVEKLAQHVACKNQGKRYSITDLKGLGKDIWKEIDADEYVAKERDSWDGYEEGA